MPFVAHALPIPPAEAAYQKTLALMDALQRDAKRSKWREPWESLADRFEALYTQNPSWLGRPHALLYAAKAYDALARRSGVREDTDKAYAYYDAFLRAHADHAEAAQALMLSLRLASAKHHAAEAKRRATILVRDYPQSPYIAIAKHFGGIKLLSASSLAKAEKALTAKYFAATQAAYQDIVDSMDALFKDARRSTWREPWETLAQRFEVLYDTNSEWPDRPLALLGAAKAYDALSRRSGAEVDTDKALVRYNLIAKAYPEQDVAEDALVASIHFSAAKRNIPRAQQALARLREQFPESVHLVETQSLLDAMGAPNKEMPSLQEMDLEEEPLAVAKPTPVKDKKKSPKSKKKRVKKVQAEKKQPDIQANTHRSAVLTAAHERIAQDMVALSKHARRSTWREPWEKLASRFIDLHNRNRTWSDSALALLDSARAYDALARRSGLKKDRHRAYAQYDTVLGLYPQHTAAEQGLFKSIQLATDMRDATELRARAKQLGKEFPQSPYLMKAQQLAALPRVGAGASIRLMPTEGEKSVIERIAWTSKKGAVTMTLTYDKAVDWLVRSKLTAGEGSPTQLIVETPRVRVNKRIAGKARVRKSLLTQVRVVDIEPKRTRIIFNLQGARSFSVKQLFSPFRLTITASSASTVIPDGVLIGGLLRPRVNAPEPAFLARLSMIPLPRMDANFAAQLGLTVRTIVIDAGHGGKDPGAMHNSLVERTLVLDVAKKVGRLLEKKGLKVIYTRKKNVWVSLEDRANFPGEMGADLFISIHLNANINPKIQGFETYYLDFAASPADKRLAAVENAVGGRSLGALEGLLADMMLGIRRIESRRLASQIQNKTLAKVRGQKYHLNDGGIRGAPFHVLMGSGIPGALIEVGYCSNKYEAKRLATNKYRIYLAQGIADGILAYVNTLQAARIHFPS